MTIIMLLLTLLVLSALITVMARTLIRSAIALACTSVLLTIILYVLASPVAAVFELSICAGLITVILISIISLTKSDSQKDAVAAAKGRLKRFWYLPVLLIAVGIGLYFAPFHAVFVTAPIETDAGIKSVFWNTRQFDIFGQIIILLTGVFGVAVLFKERRKNG